MELPPGLNEAQFAWLQRWAKAHPRVVRLVVFGSRARGDHRADSDLDVSVTLSEHDRDTGQGLWYACRAAWNAALTQALGMNVRLVRVTDDDDGGIGPAIARDGIEVWNAGAA